MGCALLEWILQIWGFFYIDRESQAVLTPNKKKMMFQTLKNHEANLTALKEKHAAELESESGRPADQRPARSRVQVDMSAHNGLRGMCAIWVVLFHIFAGRIREMHECRYTEDGTCYDKKVILDLQGCTIMPLFYVLSGFSLAVVYGGRRYRLNVDRVDLDGIDFDYWTFYKNRFARVMPGYYLSSLLALPLVFLGFGPLDPNDIKSLVASIISNIIAVPTIFNGQLPPWPYGNDFGAEGDQHPITLKNINGPAWTVCTLAWFWAVFPPIIKRVQKMTDMALIMWISIMYWMQQVLVHLIFWPMMRYESMRIANQGTFKWHLAPGDVCFNAACLNPISRLPVFIMGVLGGMLCVRYKGEPCLYWSGTWGMMFPPLKGFATPMTDVIRQLPEDEQSWGIYSKLWWAKMVDRLSLILILLFSFEIAADFWVLNYKERNEVSSQGLCGAVWMQAMMPYAYLTLAVGVTRDGGQSYTSRFFNTRIMNWLGTISFAVYLVHFPLISYMTWMIGTYPTDGKPNRPPFTLAHSNWGADDPFPFWGIFIVIPLALIFGYLLYFYFEEPMRRFLRS